MKLAYEAMDSRGGIRKEVVEATSPEEAIDLIRREGLFVTKLGPVEEKTSVEAGESGSGFRSRLLSGLGGNQKQRVLFTRQMAMLLGVGTGVVPALGALMGQVGSEKWRKALRRVHDEVERGAPLAAALSQQPAFFDQAFCSMVAAGEATASLPEMFDRLAVLAKQQWAVRNRVLGAAVYPLVLVVICLAVVAMLVLFVIPRFAGLFETLHVEVPASTAQLLRLSTLLTAHGVWVGLSCVVAITAVALLVRTPTARKGLSWLGIRLPLLGRLVRSLILARLCRLLGLLIKSRVLLLESVELTQRATGHPEYRAMMGRLREAVTEGQPLASGLGDSPLVPPAVVQAVAAGEQSGNLGDALLFVADWMDEENGQQIASLSKLCEPIVLVFMGLVVGGVAISLFMPLFDMATAAAG